jgi:DNA-binding NtrC family response regulator
MNRPLPPSKHLHGLDILIVDDDPDVAWLIADILAFDGGEAIVLPDAETAMCRLDHYHCDLLIVDIATDMHRGELVIRHADRMQPHLRNTTLVTTADPFSAGRREQLRALGRPVLYKPFDLDTLRRLVVGLVSHAARQAA